MYITPPFKSYKNKNKFYLTFLQSMLRYTKIRRTHVQKDLPGAEGALVPIPTKGLLDDPKPLVREQQYMVDFMPPDTLKIPLQAQVPLARYDRSSMYAPAPEDDMTRVPRSGLQPRKVGEEVPDQNEALFGSLYKRVDRNAYADYQAVLEQRALQAGAIPISKPQNFELGNDKDTEMADLIDLDQR